MYLERKHTQGKAKELKQYAISTIGILAVALMPLIPPAQSIQAQENAIIPPIEIVHKAGDIVPDEYIVMMQQNFVEAASLERFDIVLEGYGAKIQANLEIINGMAIKADAEEIAEIHTAFPDLHIEPNKYVSINDELSAANLDTNSVSSWGLDRIDQQNLPLDNTYEVIGGNGEGVTVYVIDSGLAPHSELPNAHEIANFIDTTDTDCNGHGTHVAGTIAGETVGVAPGVDIESIKALTCNNSGTTESVIAAVNFAVNDHNEKENRAIVNMSLTQPSGSEAIDEAVKNAANNNITMVVAAGNAHSSACIGSPSGLGGIDGIISVAASTRQDQPSNISNTGPCVDIYAPGKDIYSTWLNNEYEIISGTSMATPHVSGVAALYLQDHPGAYPAEVEEAIKTAAEKDIMTGVPTDTVNSLLNIGGVRPDIDKTVTFTSTELLFQQPVWGEFETLSIQVPTANITNSTDIIWSPSENSHPHWLCNDNDAMASCRALSFPEDEPIEQSIPLILTKPVTDSTDIITISALWTASDIHDGRNISYTTTLQTSIGEKQVFLPLIKR
ncbi:hypothetical protein BH09PAT2_BH09PAT2_03460 [soil metagenome]